MLANLIHSLYHKIPAYVKYILLAKARIKWVGPKSKDLGLLRNSLQNFSNEKGYKQKHT